MTLTAEQPTVPGEFRCPECGFVVLKSVTADRMELCPNDGTILRPVPYRDALDEARDQACDCMAKARIAEQMEVLLNNLVMRGRLSGHEKTAAQNVLSDWAAVKAKGTR